MEYFKNTNTYSKNIKTDLKDLVSIEIGDSKDLTKFQPQFKVKRWDNEVNFSVRLKDDSNEKETYSEKAEKVTWTKGTRKANLYNISPNTEYPEGAFEFEITLNEKPLTNKVEFSIETKGLDFFYQPRLTEQEKKDGVIRPEQVIDSYAVYTSEQKQNIFSGNKYKIGKIGHIYRPKIIDSNGTEVWGELNIDTKKKELIVTIPQDFLDNAIYPVKHAAGLTFGYTTVGSTSSETIWKYYLGMEATPTSSGSISSVSMYLNSTSAYYYAGLYDSSYNLLEQSNYYTGQASGVGWKTQALKTAYSIVASTTYYLFAYENCNPRSIYYDSGDASDGKYKYVYGSCSSSQTLENSLSPTNSSKKYSIYATYTATISDLEINVSDQLNIIDTVIIVRDLEFDVSVSDQLNITDTITDIINFVTIDSYSESNYDNDYPIYVDNQSVGQAFSVSVNANLSSAKFYLEAYGSPTGSANAVLYDVTGTYGTNAKPTGSALATSDNFDVSTTSGSYGLFTFNFSGSNKYLLRAGHKYAIQFIYLGGDGSNVVFVGMDTSSPTHSGNYAYATTVGTWSADGDTDTCFYVYGVLNTDLFISVTDQLNIDEDIIPNLIYKYIDVSESITLSEELPIKIDSNINLSDSINISENIISVSTLGNISVEESISIIEELFTSGQLNIISNDDLNISENIISVSTLKGIYIEENILITDNLNQEDILNVFVSNNIGISESIELFLFSGLLDISVNEDIVVSENYSETLSLFISVSDQINITDNYSELLQLFVSVNDQLNISEFIFLGYYKDTILISEYISLDMFSGLLELSTSDQISISENIIFSGQLSINVNETIGVFESIKTEQISYISILDQLNISEEVISKTILNDIFVYDSINITENSEVYISIDFCISTKDLINISENITSITTLTDIFVNDLINITDNYSKQLSLSVSVDDQVNITDNYSEQLLLSISIDDQINVTENIISVSSLSDILVNDELSITEEIGKSNLIYVNTYDGISISENINRILFMDLFVSDLITISENLGGRTLLYINKIESILISEDISTQMDIDIFVSDNLLISDNLSGTSFIFISASDLINISENNEICIVLEIDTSDSINISENLTEANIFNIVIYDLINISENVSYETFLDVSVNDSINITDNYSKQLWLFISVNDSINITENLSETKIVFISINDSINITESITLENFRFSPSIKRPIGTIHKARPVGNIHSIGRPTGGSKTIGRPSGSRSSVGRPSGSRSSIGRPHGGIN